MLSLGACVVTQPEVTFYIEFKPLNTNFIPEALNVSDMSLDVLVKNGKQPELAMQKFQDWVNNVSNGYLPVFVGFNAAFDWSFINWYFHEFVGTNPFGIGGVDIKSYYMGRDRLLWSQTKSSQLISKYPIKQQQTHNKQ